MTYLAAWIGLVEYAQLISGETLLVIGANGGVGTAAAQIGNLLGARVIGADSREPRPDSPHAARFDDFLRLKDQNIDTKIRDATEAHLPEVVFDTVGGPMFEPALRSLAHRGRLIEISSAGDRRVSLDLIDFYHNESRLFGVDTRARDAVTSGKLLAVLAPLFERGALKPPIIEEAIPLAEGRAAYEEVARGEVRGRVVLVP